MGTIFTFYSYKGGVGRTHLLANLAAYLCYYRKRKVLMIDWDLEAPGLHFYYGKTDQTIESQGLLDLFNAHIAKVRSIEADTFNEQDFIAPDSAYITPLVQAENGGAIDLMPAIDYREEGFHSKVDDFDWIEFYDKFEGGSYLLWFKEQLKQQYDYVLIDSRTGFNDYSGICNVLMPDMNIILVAPNQQNFDGAKQMAMRIVDAKYTQEKKRKPFILPVLSKIDESYGKVSDQWKKHFVDAFNFAIDLLDHDLKMVSKDVLEMIASRTTLSYNADFALGEPIHFEPSAERLSESSYLKHFENIAVNFLEEMHQEGEVSLNKVFAYAMLDILKRRVEDNPEDAEAWGGLGSVYFVLGNYQEAIVSCEKAIKFNPDFEDAWFNLGNTYSNLGNYEESVKMYQKAIEIKPNDEKAWVNLGVNSDNLGNYEEAVKAYQKAIEIKLDYEKAWVGLGNAYDKSGNYEEAVKAYQKAIEIKPDDEKAWFNLGLSYNNSGNYEESVKALKKAIEIKPDYEKAWFNLGLSYNNSGNYEKAVEAYQKAIEIKPDDEKAWFNLGVNSDDLGNYEEAVKAYQKAIEIKPDDEKAWFNLGVNSDDLGNYEEAVKAYQKAIEIKPDYEKAWVNLGNVYGQLGNYEEAKEIFQKVIELKSNDENAWIGLGFSHSNLGKYEEAIVAFQKVLEINPENKLVPLTIGWTHFIIGDLQTAKSYFEQSLELPHSQANLAHIYLIEGNTAKAMELYHQSLNAIEDKNKFWEGIESDFPHLQKQGISREVFDEIVAKLKQAHEDNTSEPS